MKELKRLMLLLAAAILSLNISAVPALKVKQTVKQSDGTSLQIVLCGDENFHYFKTIDDVPVILNDKDSYDYATMKNGRLVSTNILAHEAHLRSVSENTFVNLSKASINSDIQAVWNERLVKRNEHRLIRAEKRRLQQASGANRIRMAGATSGTVKGLVILVNFTDKKMTRTQAEFDEQFNKVGYTKNRHIGSVRDYFTSQSYGQLNIEFDVVGPYTVNNNMAYYGKDVGLEGDDAHATQMVYEACKLADADVNYADYDWDHDGEVDQVYVIYAGYGQAQGAASNTIWPHEYVLEGGGYYNTRFDNTRLSTYACSCELAGTSGTRMDGIGSACHEFSHCLGLPDFYDTTPSGGNFGMGTWSLMDTGCYNGPTNAYMGSVPAPYTSYERWFAGWLEPVELNQGCQVEGLRNIVSHPEAYVIYNDANHNEFYLLENHQKNSWDACSFGKGMLIMHVDYDETAWYENTVNNVSTRERCTIIPADNKRNVYSGYNYATTDLAGDPWPGNKKNTALTNTSTLAAKVYNRNTDGTYFMNKPITNIAENTKDSTISFTFNGGVPIAAPIANGNKNEMYFLDGTFTAKWSAVEDAESYTIELQDASNMAQQIFSQNFVNFNGDITNAGYDFAAQGVLDTYLTGGKGWTGEKVFTGQDFYSSTWMLKLGSSTATGSITTPIIKAPSSGAITIYLQAHPFNRLTSLDFDITISDANDNVITSQNFKSTNMAYTVVMNAEVDKDFKVTINTNSAQKRAYIRFISVYNAALTESEILEIEGSDAVKSMVPVTTEDNGTIIVEGITDTEYTFTGLTSTRYTYRVKATAGSRVSKWSNKVTVNLDPTGIDLITADALDGNTLVDVFTTSGQLIRKTTMANWSQSLPRGTYILRTKNAAFKLAR